MVRAQLFKKCRECGLEAHTEEDLKLFATDKDLSYGRKNYCRKCHSEASVARCIAYRKDNKQKIKEYLGGEYKCANCSVVNDYIGMFDWHHLRDKEIRVSRIMGHSWKRVRKEIKKCVFLCANCHRLEHKGEA